MDDSDRLQRTELPSDSSPRHFPMCALPDAWTPAYGHRIFEFDAFVSHRYRDGAERLVKELQARGLAIWFDGDELITNWHLDWEINRAFVHARCVILFLSPKYEISPWTVVEARVAAESEQKFGCARLILFEPSISEKPFDNMVLGNLEAKLGLPLGKRPVFSWESVDELAELCRELNTISLAHRAARNRRFEPRQHELAALRRSVEICATYSVGTTSVGQAETTDPDAEKLTSSLVESLTELGQELADPVHASLARTEASYQLFCLRSVMMVETEPPWFRPFPPSICRALRDLSMLALRSRSTDDRANAVYILSSLATSEKDAGAKRLLVRGVCAEPNKAVIRLFLHHLDALGLKLPGLPMLELKLAQQVGDKPPHIENFALPLMSPVMRLRVQGMTAGLRPSDLPVTYQVELSLHWMEMLTLDVQAASESFLGMSELDRIHPAEGIDLELCCRDLYKQTRALFSEHGPSAGERIKCLERCAAAIERMVETSERCADAPLQYFSEYFLDYLLPQLGVIVIFIEEERARALAMRCFSIMSRTSFGHEVPGYQSFIDACSAWRQEHGSVLTERDSPVCLAYEDHFQFASVDWSRALYRLHEASRRNRNYR